MLRLRGGADSITIKNLINANESSFSLAFETFKVSDLKMRLSRDMAIPESRIVLTFDGKRLSEDDKLLKNLGVKSGSIIEFSYPTFREIVQLQSADGYWGEDILETFDFQTKDLEKEIPEELKKQVQDKDVARKCYYTLMGLKGLTTKYPGNEKEWKLVAKKAKSILTRHQVTADTFLPLVSLRPKEDNEENEAKN